MSAGMVLLSESEVSLHLISFTHNVCLLEWGCYQKHLSPCLSYFDSVHACSECPLMQRCCERSPVSHCPVSVFMHTAMSAEWCCRPGWIIKAPPPLIHNVFTHTHIKCTMRNGAATKGHRSQHCLVNSPFLYTMKGDITHRRPLPSHTNSPS